MPGAVYSERFMAVNSPQTWHAWTCPVGQRAVIQTGNFTNYGETAQVFQVQIVTFMVVYLQLPAHELRAITDWRLVLYGGETLYAYMTAGGLACAFAGYLFDDAAGRQAPPATIVEGDSSGPHLPTALPAP